MIIITAGVKSKSNFSHWLLLLNVYKCIFSFLNLFIWTVVFFLIFFCLISYILLYICSQCCCLVRKAECYCLCIRNLCKNSKVSLCCLVHATGHLFWCMSSKRCFPYTKRFQFWVLAKNINPQYVSILGL